MSKKNRGFPNKLSERINRRSTILNKNRQWTGDLTKPGSPLESPRPSQSWHVVRVRKFRQEQNLQKDRFLERYRQRRLRWERFEIQRNSALSLRGDRTGSSLFPRFPSRNLPGNPTGPGPVPRPPKPPNNKKSRP